MIQLNCQSLLFIELTSDIIYLRRIGFFIMSLNVSILDKNMETRTFSFFLIGLQKKRHKSSQGVAHHYGVYFRVVFLQNIKIRIIFFILISGFEMFTLWLESFTFPSMKKYSNIQSKETFLKFKSSKLNKLNSLYSNRTLR